MTLDVLQLVRRPVAPAYVVTMSALCLQRCPVPCHVDGTPPRYATLRQLRHSMLQFWRNIFVFYLSSLPSFFGSLVSSLAHQLDIGMLVLVSFCSYAALFTLFPFSVVTLRLAIVYIVVLMLETQPDVS